MSKCLFRFPRRTLCPVEPDFIPHNRKHVIEKFMKPLKTLNFDSRALGNRSFQKLPLFISVRYFGVYFIPFCFARYFVLHSSEQK